MFCFLEKKQKEVLQFGHLRKKKAGWVVAFRNQFHFKTLHTEKVINTKIEQPEHKVGFFQVRLHFFSYTSVNRLGIFCAFNLKSFSFGSVRTNFPKGLLIWGLLCVFVKLYSKHSSPR